VILVLSYAKPPAGKLPIETIEPMFPVKQSRKLLSVSNDGINVGVTLSKGKYIVSSSDPITGAVERVGWHALNVSANDVATSGIMPDMVSVVALFPEGVTPSEVARAFDEITETAGKLGIVVAGRRTEISPNLKQQILIITAIGSGDDFVTSGGAKANDAMLITKTAGIEGTSILSRLPRVRMLMDSKTLEKAAKLLDHLSIMKDAKLAFGTGKVHAMHDLTEGGVIGCALEMSLASKLGFEIFSDKVPIDDSTQILCEKIAVDPLKLIGSGSLLIACPNDRSGAIIDTLRENDIPCAEIGRFRELGFGRWIVSRKGKLKLTGNSVQDELWPALRKYGDLS
jgi:hydrogenase expression/formation protein HypE